MPTSSERKSSFRNFSSGSPALLDGDFVIRCASTNASRQHDFRRPKGIGQNYSGAIIGGLERAVNNTKGVGNRVEELVSGAHRVGKTAQETKSKNRCKIGTWGTRSPGRIFPHAPICRRSAHSVRVVAWFQ